MTTITINPALDPEALNRIYQKTGRLQIPEFFTPETAEYLWSLVRDNQIWYLAYNNGNQFYESPMAEYDALTPQQKAQFRAQLYRSATHRFQYFFTQYYITQAIKLGEDEGHPLHQVEAFVNSPAYLEFMRVLTGEAGIRKADSYASRYEAGQFLTEHNDNHPTHDRVAACVFGLTKEWNRNWGGHLAFYDDQGNIEQAFMPSFNTLNILAIPQNHGVQQVSTFAGARRYSLLSWLHR